MVDWVFRDNEWSIWKGGWVQSEYGGWFRVYAFTMTLGVICAILFSAYKFWRKDLQLTQLGIGAVPIVIVSLLGASFFGKLNSNETTTDLSNPSEFWGLFAFWHGGMAIHGGVFAGSLVGIIIFYFMGRKTKVSVWTYMDAIIPNILIGQGIGRWGNFFNHEITGPPIGLASKNPLWWLPDFITNNTQATYIGPVPAKVNGIDLQFGELYQLNPIFVYEAFWLIVAWAIITFVLPNFLKWFQKRPENFAMSKMNVALKNEYENLFTGNNVELSFTTFKKWKYDRLYHFSISKYGMDNYHVVKAGLDEARHKKEINFFQYHWKNGKALEEANNPYRLKTVKAGVEAGAYFLTWNIVRFALELQRPTNHLFIQNDKPLSLIVIGLTGLIGLLIMISCQFIAPYLFRKPGYYYEKEYFKVYELEKVKKVKESKTKMDNAKLANIKSKEMKAQEKLEKLKQKAK